MFQLAQDEAVLGKVTHLRNAELDIVYHSFFGLFVIEGSVVDALEEKPKHTVFFSKSIFGLKFSFDDWVENDFLFEIAGWAWAFLNGER